MDNKELGVKILTPEKALGIFGSLDHKLKPHRKGVEKADSHSILFWFLWFTNDISLLLCACPSGTKPYKQ